MPADAESHAMQSTIGHGSQCYLHMLSHAKATVHVKLLISSHKAQQPTSIAAGAASWFSCHSHTD